MKLSTHKLRIIWYFFRPHKVRSAILLFTMVFSGFTDMLNLAILYPVVNYGLHLENNTFILRAFDRAVKLFTVNNQFFVSCIFLMIITVIAVISKIMYTYFSSKLMINIVGVVQKEIFQKFLTADYDFFVRNQQGKLIHMGMIAPDHVANVVLFTTRFLHDLIQSLFLFSLLLVLTWRGTSLILIIGAVYFLFVKRILEKIIYKCATIANEEDRKKNVILNEFISGIKSIKIYHVFNSWKEKYINTVDKKLHNHFKTLMAGILPESFVKFFYYFILAIIGIVLSNQSQKNLISLIPLFGIFVMVANRFMPTILAIGSDVMGLVHCMPNAMIVYDLHNKEINIITDGKENLKGFNNNISFKNVWFKYESTKEYLLRGLSFDIKKRQVTAIVGPSGSGKTTIVNLLFKLYTLNGGVICFDGVDIFTYSNKSYLEKFGYVGQETFIYNDTIRENIRFGVENCTDDMIEEAAKLANAHEFIMETHDGYETLVGDSGMKLSGGQRQRIAIARAMLRKPEILVLDEATSSLDNIAEKKVQEAINRVSLHTTVLIIAHRLSTVSKADKIVVLENGSIREEGTHKELIESNGLYFNLYNQQKILGSVKASSSENV